MNALDIMYPQYWLQATSKMTFFLHLATLKPNILCEETNWIIHLSHGAY
jgi:hypothetical protein